MPIHSPEPAGQPDVHTADNRAIALLVICRLLATLANTSCFVVGVLGTAVYDLEASVFEVSILMLVVNLAMIVGNAVGGLAIDLLGPRKVLVGGLLGYTLTAIVFFLMPLSLTTLTLLNGLYSLVYGAIITTFTSLPPFVVTDASLPRANSLMSTAENAAYIIGPALGGAVALAWSAQGCFAVLGIGGLLAVPCVLALPKGASAPVAEKPASTHKGAAYLVEGFKLAFSTPALACLVPMAFLAYFAFGAFDSLETVFYRDVLQVGVEWTGWLNAIMGVGATLGSLLLLKVPERAQDVSLAAWLTALVGAGTVVYVATSNPWIAAIGMAILGMGWGLFEPLLNLIVQRDAPEGAVGRVMGVLQMGQRSSGVLPLLAAPFLAQIFGVQPVLVAAGVIATVAGLVFVGIARRAVARA